MGIVDESFTCSQTMEQKKDHHISRRERWVKSHPSQREVLRDYLMKKEKVQKYSKLIKWFGIASISILTALLTSTVLTNERILESLETQVHEDK